MLHQCKLPFVLVLCMRLLLEVHVASDICNVCSCSGSPINVNCQNLRLSSVPQPIPANVLTINLNGNNITVIQNGTFRNLHRLMYLYIDNNKITHIRAGAFENLTVLQQLNLNGNKITVIQNGTFRNLHSLKYLYIEKNKITHIRAGAFENLTVLQQLYIRNNVITVIEAGSFQNLPDLEYLYLDSNKMTNIGEGTFENLTNLKALYLPYNNIENIEEGSFQILTKLEHLDLSNNKITSIDAGITQNIHNLKNINLRANLIQKYEDGAFLFLPKIAEIDLSENNDMMCVCHLPALVNYMKKAYNRAVIVKGKCRTDLGNNQIKVIPILTYSQCQHYLLFQFDLLCETCSGVMCNASKVTACPGVEPVCQYNLTNGVTQTDERSCSTYRECIDAAENNVFACHQQFNGPSCITCCIGRLCNKYPFPGSTTSFDFHLIYTTKNIKIPPTNVSRAMEQDFLNLTGIFKVEFCGSNKNSEIFTIKCTVQKEITKDEIWHQLSNVLKTSQTLRNLGIQQYNVSLISGMFCYENTTSTDDDTFTWPMTKVGTTARVPCHPNVATRHCSSRTSQYMASPKCLLFTGIWQEPDMSQCNNKSNITQQLQKINNESINLGNIKEKSQRLVDISQKSENFREEDINLSVKILEKMLPFLSNLPNDITLNKILLSVNNIMDTPETVLVEEHQTNNIANRLLDIIETISEKVSLEEQQVTVLYSNVGIGVIKVDNDTFNGAFYGILHGNNETEAKNMIYNSTHPPQVNTTMMDFISLPKSILKDLNDEEQSALSRVSFSSVRDKLYRVIRNASVTENTKINSYVISASIPNIANITNLDEPVAISFNLIIQNATNPRCVYWDESSEQKPKWSSKGCEVFRYVHGEKVTCSCNHLTSFSLLMDFYGTNITSPFLSVISYVGCGISLVFLILTILIHIYLKKLRKLMSSKILVNLCSSLAVTNLIFIVGTQRYVTDIIVCKAVAAVLHYFLMTSIMWTTVEALHVSLSVVVIFGTFQKSFLKRNLILAWGLPAVIVIINLVINNTDNYVKYSGICWLSRMSFYATFLCPMGIALIYNLTLFALVIWRLITVQNNKKFGHKTRKIRVLGIIGLFFLFGLTWGLPIFAIDEVAEAFTYIFTFLITFQGMFVFIFYCVYKKDTREIVRLHLCNRKKEGLKKVTKNKNSNSGDKTEDNTEDLE